MALYRKIELQATPAQVWDAVATGPGMSSWFNPTELEPRVGGIGRTDFGGGTFSEGTVRVYEPGRRIVFGTDRIARGVGAVPEDEPGPGLEFWIAASDDTPDDAFGGLGADVSALRGRQSEAVPIGRGFGERLVTSGPAAQTTTLHFRQRGFPEADQETYEAGWDVYFHTLSEYLTSFVGKPPLTIAAIALPHIDRNQQFAKILEGLGLENSNIHVGDEVVLNPVGMSETIPGVVDVVMTNNPHLDALGVRVADGFFRATSADLGSAINFYHYVVDPPPDFSARTMASLREANVAAAETWQTWLQQQLGS